MAIGIGDVQKGFSSNGTVTVSMTLSAGSILTAQAEVNNPSVTLSATWNGSAMTEVIKVTNATTDAYVYIWKHLTPDSGTHNLVISQSGSSAVNGGGVELTGASDTGATNSNNQTSNNAPTVALTTTVANSVVLNIGTAGGGDSSATTATATGTNQTERWQRTSGNSRDTFVSTQTTTTAGSYTSSWSLTASFATTMLAVEIKPTIATANGNFLDFM